MTRNSHAAHPVVCEATVHGSYCNQLIGAVTATRRENTSTTMTIHYPLSFFKKYFFLNIHFINTVALLPQGRVLWPDGVIWTRDSRMCYTDVKSFESFFFCLSCTYFNDWTLKCVIIFKTEAGIFQAILLPNTNGNCQFGGKIKYWRFHPEHECSAIYYSQPLVGCWLLLCFCVSDVIINKV